MKNYEEQDHLEALFRDVEPRPQPGEEVTDRAWTAVEAQWSELQKSKRSSTVWNSLALAATFLIGVIGLTLWQGSSEVEIIQVRLAQGVVQIGEGVEQQTIHHPGLLTLQLGTAIASSGVSRWSLADGTDIRLADATTLRWLGSNEVSLLEGDIFISTEGADSFVVQTKFGRVSDVGTQFIVSADATGLEVAVREGLVKVASPTIEHLSAPLKPGEASIITVQNSHVVETSAHPADSRWSWVHEAPAGYSSNNPLELLKQIARDLGKRLEFSSPGVRASLANETVVGDFKGMTPSQALTILSQTSGFDWRENEDALTIHLRAVN